MNVKSSLPAVDSTSRSMWGRGKLSFGQALLRSVKSTQMCHLPFFFMTTGLASHSGYRTSTIDPTLSNRSTSSLTAFDRSGPNLRCLCRIGSKVGSTLSSCVTIFGSIPFMSSVFHAKANTFFFNKVMILSLMWSER